MLNLQQFSPILQQLRANDRVRELTAFQQQPLLSDDIQDVLVALLQFADQLGVSVSSKFKARTMFLAGVRSLPEFAEVAENKQAIALTSLQIATQNTPQHQTILNLEQTLGLSPQPYLLTPTHQWLATLLSLVEQDLPNLTCPSAFSEQLLPLIGNPQVCHPLAYLVELALLYFQTSSLTAEEIFVGCTLYVCTKPGMAVLLNWVETTFAEALLRGRQLKEMLVQQIQNLVPDEL